MPVFKFENCTSKQYVRNYGWIPEALARKKHLGESPKARRVRYLTFCAEGAIDVIALRNANVIKRSTKKLYDTVVFFDFAPQSVDRTLEIIEGANGFPVDFFKLVNLPVPEDPDEDAPAEIFRESEESDELFLKNKERVLYHDFQRSFPFDLINLDVERYLLRPSEELPGQLLTAWDRILEWQKKPGNHDGKPYKIDEFTVFFTTKLGPEELPEEHRASIIGVVDQNLAGFPGLKTLIEERFAVQTAGDLYSENYPEFMKIAVPKALISRALRKDWVLDTDRSFKSFKFDRHPPASSAYTMVHYILHFKRCVPSIDGQINPFAIPPDVLDAYRKSAERIFTIVADDVDVAKLPIEADLVQQLQQLGVGV